MTPERLETIRKWAELFAPDHANPIVRDALKPWREHHWELIQEVERLQADRTHLLEVIDDYHRMR